MSKIYSCEKFSFSKKKLTYAEEQGMKDLTKFYPLDTTL